MWRWNHWCRDPEVLFAPAGSRKAHVLPLEIVRDKLAIASAFALVEITKAPGASPAGGTAAQALRHGDRDILRSLIVEGDLLVCPDALQRDKVIAAEPVVAN